MWPGFDSRLMYFTPCNLRSLPNCILSSTLSGTLADMAPAMISANGALNREACNQHKYREIICNPVLLSAGLRPAKTLTCLLYRDNRQRPQRNRSETAAYRSDTAATAQRHHSDTRANEIGLKHLRESCGKGDKIEYGVHAKQLATNGMVPAYERALGEMIRNKHKRGCNLDQAFHRTGYFVR